MHCNKRDCMQNVCDDASSCKHIYCAHITFAWRITSSFKIVSFCLIAALSRMSCMETYQWIRPNSLVKKERNSKILCYLLSCSLLYSKIRWFIAEIFKETKNMHQVLLPKKMAVYSHHNHHLFLLFDSLAVLDHLLYDCFTSAYNWRMLRVKCVNAMPWH